MAIERSIWFKGVWALKGVRVARHSGAAGGQRSSNLQ